jgi:hypothetical protein
MPWDFHRRLTALYHDLASREIRRGRHRRAAFIYGHLLGDFEAAATTLMSGGHWREAAVLYQQRLGRPLDAAQCLEQGGLWSEAMSLYEQLGHYEHAGDLSRQLEHEEQALRLYQIAVDEHRSKGDLTSAARILDEKMQTPDDAIDLLASGWPDSSQAGQCLRDMFRILGRLGRHDVTAAWISRFRKPELPADGPATLTNFLAETASAYPDLTVRHQAGDAVLAIVSSQLAASNLAERRQLLWAVQRLAPEDRLLRRDCQRYDSRMAAVAKPSICPPPRRRKGPIVQLRIRLPEEVDWRAVIRSGPTICAAGTSHDHLLLVRCNWRGRLDRLVRAWRLARSLAGPAPAPSSPIILAANPLGRGPLLCHLVGGPILPMRQVFNANDRFPRPVHAGALPGLSRQAVAAVCTAGGITWVVESRQTDVTLVGLTASGRHIATEATPSVTPWGQDTAVLAMFPLPLCALGERVYVGISDHLMIFDRGSGPELVQVDGEITALAGPAPHSRARIAIALQHGGIVYWDDFQRGHMEAFASDMPMPVVGLNRGGYLIAASEDSCEIYSTQGRRVEPVAELDGLGCRPLAVLSGPQPDQFGIATTEGELTLFTMDLG